LTDAEKREALRCLKGSIYRAEKFRHGEEEPFSIALSSSKVQLFQAMGEGKHASFLVTPLETVSIYNEEKNDDARVTHTIVLSTDKYGHVLEKVGIHYKRANEDSSLPEEIRKAQGQNSAIYKQFVYTSELSDGDIYMLPKVCGEYSYELLNLPDSSSKLFTPGDFDKCARRLLSASRILYLAKDMKSALPYGQLSFPGIQYETYTLAFTDDIIKDAYGNKLTSEILEREHYVKDELGWWISSGKASFILDCEKPEKAYERFYTPLAFTDHFGAETTVSYHDSTYLLLSSVENSYGEVTSIEEFDYSVLQPTLVKDINGNLTAASYDESGRLLSIAKMGKGSGYDSLDGVGTGYELEIFRETDYEKLETLAHRLLGNATQRFIYDVNSYEREGVPARTAVIRREKHGCEDSPVQIHFTYSDSNGNLFLEKAQAEPEDGSSKPRWLGSGRAILNNKGSVVMKYEPFFSDTPFFEDKPVGITPVYYYDPLGRKIRSEYPDGTFESVEIHAWSVAVRGAGDNVKDTEWYKKHIACANDTQEHRAAEKSEQFQDTAAIFHFDSIGRTVAMEEAGISNFTTLDIEGKLLSETDALGNVVQRYKYDLLGRVLYSEGSDNGKRWIFEDAAGKPLLSWNDRGHRLEYSYDEFRRPLSCKVTSEEIQEGEIALDNIFARWKYAEDILTEENKASLQAINALGQALEQWDTAGKITNKEFDLNGMPLCVDRRLAADFRNTVNWTDDVLESALEEQNYSASCETDAFGRIVHQVSPDGSELFPEYNGGGLLMSEALILSRETSRRTLIEHISYNERRSRSYVKYGNGVETKYSFDPENFRLTGLHTTRSNGSVLQDLSFWFDIAGNLSYISDKGSRKCFHGNKTVSADSDFQYDVWSRLILAKGRENNAALSQDAFDRWDDKGFMSELLDMDSLNVREYTEEYEYDAVGNMLKMHHSSEGNSWTRKYEYENGSNRLVATTVGDYTYNYSFHPRHGFMTSMPHLSSIAWDFLDRMTRSSRQHREDGGIPETTWYQYDGTGKRIRKVTLNASGTSESTLKEESVYIGGYELYRKYSGSCKGLERSTLSVMDGMRRFAIIERRNEVDDGTDELVIRYQLENHNGSSSIETDENGALLTLEEYTPYGAGAYQFKSKSARIAAKRYRFTGMERDLESGFSYHGARYYAPWLARWICADPDGTSDGLNIFLYCHCNPLTMNDRNGTDGWDYFFGVVSVVTSAVEIVGGVVAIASGVGVAAGVVAVIHGFDGFYHGVKTLATGESQNTWTQDAVTGLAELAGLPEPVAEVVGVVADVAIGFKIDRALKKAAQTTAKGIKSAEQGVKNAQRALDHAESVKKQGIVKSELLSQRMARHGKNSKFGKSGKTLDEVNREHQLGATKRWADVYQAQNELRRAERTLELTRESEWGLKFLENMEHSRVISLIGTVGPHLSAGNSVRHVVEDNVEKASEAALAEPQTSVAAVTVEETATQVAPEPAPAPEAAPAAAPGKRTSHRKKRAEHPKQEVAQPVQEAVSGSAGDGGGGGGGGETATLRLADDEDFSVEFFDPCQSYNDTGGHFCFDGFACVMCY